MIDARLLKRLPPERGSDGFELNIHVRAEAGIAVLFGSSGAGKTLTLNCLAGFAKPDEGRILVRDEIYFDAASRVNLPPQKRRCGYIFQDHALFPHMTVRENLRFAASVAPRDKTPRLQRYRKINELLEMLELGDLGGRKPAQLSSGQKQRAALARVLVGEPTLLLLDEPARGLDARLRSAFYGVLEKTRAHLNVPLVLVTHDVEECFELADFVCLMERGKVLQAGTRDAVFGKPASVEVARMLGVYNLVRAEITALDPGRNTSKLALLDQSLGGPYLPGHLIGDRGWVVFRERETRVMPVRDTEANNLALGVQKTSPVAMGVRIQFAEDLCATVSESEWQQLRGREQLWMKVPASALHFIG